MYPVQEMGDIKPSLTIKLYHRGFALGDQVCFMLSISCSFV